MKITIYHPVNCRTPGEPFQVTSKTQAEHYFKKGFTPKPPTDIPLDVLNKNLMAKLREEMSYLREDYGNGEWEETVQEEYELLKFVPEKEILDEMGIVVQPNPFRQEKEFDALSELLFESIKKMHPIQKKSIEDWEGDIIRIYDAFILDQGYWIRKDYGEDTPAPPVIEEVQTPDEEQISIPEDPQHNCETCGKEHDGTFGSGRFCCQKCSSTFGLKKHQGTAYVNTNKSSG